MNMRHRIPFDLEMKLEKAGLHEEVLDFLLDMEEELEEDLRNTLSEELAEEYYCTCFDDIE